MGGHAAGEVASEMAVQIIQRELANVRDLDGEDVVQTRRRTALKHANRTIHDRTITEVDKQGMGTTASVLLLAAIALPHRPGRRLARVSPARRHASSS